MFTCSDISCCTQVMRSPSLQGTMQTNDEGMRTFKVTTAWTTTCCILHCYFTVNMRSVWTPPSPWSILFCCQFLFVECIRLVKVLVMKIIGCHGCFTCWVGVYQRSSPALVGHQRHQLLLAFLDLGVACAWGRAWSIVLGRTAVTFAISSASTQVRGLKKHHSNSVMVKEKKCTKCKTYKCLWKQR